MLELRDGTLIDLARSGARHGLGLFETILVREGRALRLDWHLERLSSGCRFLHIDEPPGADLVADFASERLGLAGLEIGALRLLALDGFLALTLSPGAPPPFGSPEAALSTSLRRFSGSPLCRFKTLSYLENLLLVREAEERGLAETIALNEVGNLSDGGRTSVFFVLRGELLTPRTEDGALPGIARRLILEKGLARESSLAPADLDAIDAAFLANALRGVFALERFEGRELDPGHPSILAAARLFAP